LPKNSSDDIEPHEVLLDSLAKKREHEFGLSEKKFEVPLARKLLQGFFIFSILVLTILFLKTFQLQVLEREAFTVRAEENKFIIHQIKAERGIIYDKDLNQLVLNRPNFDLICQKVSLPEEEKERENILAEVAKIIKKDPAELEKIITESQEPTLLISENLDYQTLLILETRLKEFAGFQIEKNSVREYQQGAVFSHLIGYKRKSGQKTGLEEFYDDVIGEKPGEIRIERDVKGNLISQEIVSLPESGKGLVLWLDSDLQKKTMEALENSLKRVGAKSGAAVALNPQTGAVLALVSLPTFNNNLFSEGMNEAQWQEINNDPTKPLFNRTISAGFLTGSTIKPLIASAALEEKIINPEKSINCQGFISIPNPWDPSASTTKKDWTAHGWTNLRKAIAESCNVYFYTVGGGLGSQEGLGPTRIKKYLELFSWGEKTGIDLPGEISGFIPDKAWKKETWKADWWDGDTYNLAIGQGFLQITPLEVALSFSAIANGGTLYQPQVAQKIVDAEKNTIEELKPKIIRQNFISPENLKIVREGMRQAVTGVNSPQASAVTLSSLPVAVAAKTGTAELGNNYYHNWVTVFAPYENPQIVITVMIEKVKGDMVAALPVAKEILEWYFTQEHNF